MLRVQWCSRLILSVLCFFHSFFFAGGECWYNDELHPEGLEVLTPEPCLNCTCSRGALLCYLRVCPPLPNPPPSGCILLHRYHTCCPELICADNNKNSIEARSSIDDNNLLQHEINPGKACVVNGSVYAPGSAMDSSSLCEYCYCLGGKQVCVKPKCLLPVSTCVPSYDSSSCCPVRYDCTNATTTTTTMKTEVGFKGCMVDGTYHEEGTKVLGAGHTECDNCYCLGGVLRCEPLACAPPLFGCSPTIRAGDCCAISYNCSGVIEINAEPNYGDFPTISKDYAKFHNEVPHTTKTQRNTDAVFDSSDNSLLLEDRFNRKIDTTALPESTTDGTTETTEEGGTETVGTVGTSTWWTEEPTETPPEIVTVILNSTDCIDGTTPREDMTSLAEESKSTTVPPANTSERTNAVVNSDYEYDYNEASLPPSLPNLRIIPFVAADALDLENTEQSVAYQESETNNGVNYNLFSPPVETEGGFVPKEPLILDNFYENVISSTSIPKIKLSCVVKDQEVAHGEAIEATSCETCRCFYGNVVCEKVKCPSPKLGCHVSLEDSSSCCPRHVCDDAPGSPLQDSLSHPQNSSRILTDRTTLATERPAEDSSDSPGGFSVDQVLNFLFFNQETNQTSTAPPVKELDKEEEEESLLDRSDLAPSLAILKLAGCNIYGRMYRVGRIISELSNPCLECKCTEIGVQCKALSC